MARITDVSLPEIVLILVAQSCLVHMTLCTARVEQFIPVKNTETESLESVIGKLDVDLDGVNLLDRMKYIVKHLATANDKNSYNDALGPLSVFELLNMNYYYPSGLNDCTKVMIDQLTETCDKLKGERSINNNLFRYCTFCVSSLFDKCKEHILNEENVKEKIKSLRQSLDGLTLKNIKVLLKAVGKHGSNKKIKKELEKNSNTFDNIKPQCKEILNGLNHFLFFKDLDELTPEIVKEYFPDADHELAVNACKKFISSAENETIEIWAKTSSIAALWHARLK